MSKPLRRAGTAQTWGMWTLRPSWSPYCEQELPADSPRMGKARYMALGSCGTLTCDSREPLYVGLGSWKTLACGFWVWWTPDCGFGGYWLPYKTQARGAAEAWTALLGSDQGKEAKRQELHPRFSGSTLSTDPPTHLIPVLEQILGSTVGCLMWLILSTV